MAPPVERPTLLISVFVFWYQLVTNAKGREIKELLPHSPLLKFPRHLPKKRPLSFSITKPCSFTFTVKEKIFKSQNFNGLQWSI